MNRDQFAAARRRLSDHTAATLRRMFLAQESFRDPAPFVAQAVPVLQGAQQELAALTAVWVAEQASNATGRAIAPPGIPSMASVNLRRGVKTAEVYARPFTTIYTALAKGKPFDQATQLGATRLGEIAEMDLQATYAHASRAAMQGLPAGAQPSGWRRVLVGEKNCALCVVASTQRYHRADLNPIHPACNCTVEMLFGTRGQVIDEALLEQAHQAVFELTGKSDRGARAPDYRKVALSCVAAHGELGGVLVRPGDHFTGPGEL